MSSATHLRCSEIRLPTFWLSEIFVNLAVHAFVATQLPANLPTLEVLPTVGVRSRKLAARMRAEGTARWRSCKPTTRVVTIRWTR
jgi:hypothetical protein